MTGAPEIVRITELPALRERPANSHKGTFGKALIIAGSRGMAGAAGLSGTAALRGGAGLVTVATPSCAVPIVASYEPSYLTLPLEEDDQGHCSLQALPRIMDALSTQTAAGIGPGLGTSTDLDELVHMLYRTNEKPLVIDADGLNALAHRPEALTRPPMAGPRILTPHPGEFARLSGSTVAAIQENRELAAAEFAQRHGVILVLKGAGTVVTDGQRLYVNTTGNGGMSTGGTGDVLTGLLTALLAQEMEAFDAAHLAVYLHGLAGDLAAAELSQPGLIASDLLKFLPKAWLKLLS